MAVLGTVVMLFTSCSYHLTQSGASIPIDQKTIDIEFFENTAPLVVPTLSQQFTEALKDRIRTQTKLSIVRGEEANSRMSGAITGYSYGPVSIQATNPNTAPIAGASRLTITVRVKYLKYDYKDGKKLSEPNKKLSFDESFSKSLNYTGDLSTQEQTLIQQINKQLTDDIFNRAFANW